MRILQLHVRHREPGGEDVVVAAEAEQLRALGHTVETVEESNPEGARAAAMGLIASPWNPAAARRVSDLLERVRPDVVHVHNQWFAGSPSAMGRIHRSGIPMVVTLHNYRALCPAAIVRRDDRRCTDCVGRLPLPAIRHGCYRGSRLLSTVASATSVTTLAALRNARWLIAPTEQVRAAHLEGGLSPDRVVVKPHAAPDPGQRTAPPSSSREVLFVGRLVEEKGVVELVEQWNGLEVDLDLVIIGDGPLASEIDAVAGSRVRRIGALSHDEVVGRMLLARALVFPSLWPETFGLVAAEAMAAGLPVLATGHPGAIEVLDGTGDLLHPEDPALWPPVLASLADDGRVDVMGASARASYLRRLTPAVSGQRLATLYDAAVTEVAA